MSRYMLSFYRSKGLSFHQLNSKKKFSLIILDYIEALRLLPSVLIQFARKDMD